MALSSGSFAGNTTTDFVTGQGLCNTGKTFVTMTLGGSFAIPTNVYRVFLRGTALLGSFSLQLPMTTNLMDGKTVLMISNQIISFLTLTANTGDTMADTLSGIGMQQRFGFTYDFPTKAWYRSS